MNKALLVVSLLSITAIPGLRAQNAPGGIGRWSPDISTMVQRQVARLNTLLDLNPTQQQQVTDLLTINETANQKLRSTMRTAEQALRSAEQNKDTAGVQAAATEIGTVTGEMTANRSTLRMGLATILTADQMAKYKALGPGAGGRGFGPGRPPAPAGIGGAAGIQ